MVAVAVALVESRMDRLRHTCKCWPHTLVGTAMFSMAIIASHCLGGVL